MYIKSTILLLLVLLSSLTYSQKELGRELVDKLASDEFYGRGYVNDGDKIAAQYIADQFKKYGAKSIDTSYFQKFKLDVNTFPGKVELFIGAKKLKVGEDFIIDAKSGSASGEYKLVKMDYDKIDAVLGKYDFNSTEFPKVAFVIEFPKPKDRKERADQYYVKQVLASKTPLIIINDNKFTWTVGSEALNYPILEVKSDFFKGDSVATINVENKFIRNYESQNVIGIVPAKRKCKRKKYIFFTAHYDHLGMMGTEATMNGANDNASGTAMMITLMKHYAESKPEYTMVFVGFGGEEAGLVGSKYFVENPMVPLDKIKFVVNVDLMGTGSEGITVVNATENPKEFEWMQKINEKEKLLKQIKKRGKAANSDHYYFQENGVPAFFMYTMGGVTHYHDIKDRPETLPLTEFNDLHKFIRSFVAKF